MRVRLTAELDPRAKRERPALKMCAAQEKPLGHESGAALQEGELVALAAQALEAQKADKPLEQGGALEQVAARIKWVMGLTAQISRPP